MKTAEERGGARAERKVPHRSALKITYVWRLGEREGGRGEGGGEREKERGEGGGEGERERGRGTEMEG